MFTRSVIFAAVAMLSFVSFVSAGTKTVTVIVGGHDPGRMVQTITVPERVTPYALTGTAATVQQYEEIRIGNRVVAQRPVQR